MDDEESALRKTSGAVQMRRKQAPPNLEEDSDYLEMRTRAFERNKERNRFMEARKRYQN